MFMPSTFIKCKMEGNVALDMSQFYVTLRFSRCFYTLVLENKHSHTERKLNRREFASVVFFFFVFFFFFWGGGGGLSVSPVFYECTVVGKAGAGIIFYIIKEMILL